VAHRLIVVGSANVDYVIRVPTLPAAGQTLLGGPLRILPGGKGMNQAVASSRMGAEVRFVGSVGADPDGQLLLAALAVEGIGTDDVKITSAERTGLAIVSVLPSGENTITVVPGANSVLDAAAVQRVVQAAVRPGDLVVVQCEIPVPAICSAVATATAGGARVVINLAPYTALPEPTLRAADPLVVNEVEAADLGGEPVATVDEAMIAAAVLASRARSVVLTLGSRGACWAAAGTVQHVPAPTVTEVVDTTGAGDAFVGALAARLADGAGLADAVSLAVEIAAVSVTRPGAQTSYPRRDEIASLR
jgi:ribokinase